MKWISKCQALCLIGGLVSGLVLVPHVLAGGPKVRKYRYSDVDMPISLAVGTVRTPEFAVKPEAYFIMVQAEKRLPFYEMQCMMALATGLLEKDRCNTEPLLQAEWTVRDNEHIVAQGTSSREASDMYTDEHMFKILGQFMGESDKKYVVEVRSTQDGTPLNVCNPHLIVILVRKH